MHGRVEIGDGRVEPKRRAPATGVDKGQRLISIRGGMGLGDSLYVQAIARHLVNKRRPVEVCSKWPEVFIPLGDWVKVSPFRRKDIDLLAHYALRKDHATDQFVDCCLQAGISEPVELKLDWQTQNPDLVNYVKAKCLPVVLVQLPRQPMDRKDAYGIELLPERKALQRAIDAVADRALIVQVGKGNPLYELKNIDVDMADRTSVSDLIDLAYMCDAMIGYVSFFVPLAESFDKPLLSVWSRRGLRSRTDYVRKITPQKIFHKKTSVAVMDDDSEDRIADVSRSLLG